MTEAVVKTIGANRLILRSIPLDQGPPATLLVRQTLIGGEWGDTDLGIEDPMTRQLAKEMADELLKPRGPMPQQPLIEYPSARHTLHLLHQLWTKAVGTPGYNKKEWQELEGIVEGLLRQHTNLLDKMAKGSGQ